LDLSFLDGFCRGDRATALEILRDFRDSSRIDLQDLRSAADQRDLAHMARLAHRIKGASAMVGALALAEAAKALEALARAGEGEGQLLQPLFDALATLESTFAHLDHFTAHEIKKG
jgi:HPt (histidine-containing phosphotransfer) domain-containing protein